MPGPGPLASHSPAPLRALLLLLCALAPGAPGPAPGGWAPRSPPRRGPSVLLGPLARPSPPPGVRRDRVGWGAFQIRLCQRPCPCGKKSLSAPGLQCPQLGRCSARPSRGLSSEGLHRAQSTRKGVDFSPSSVRLCGKQVARRCGPPVPRPPPASERPAALGGVRSRTALHFLPPPRLAGLRRASGRGAPGASGAAEQPAWGFRSRGCGIPWSRSPGELLV